MSENPRRGRGKQDIYNKYSEHPRSEIVFRTDIFRNLTLGAWLLFETRFVTMFHDKLEAGKYLKAFFLHPILQLNII